MQVKILTKFDGPKLQNALPLSLIEENSRKNILFRLFLFDFTKLDNAPQNYRPNTINPDGTIMQTQFTSKLRKAIKYLLELKEKHETKDLRIRFHFLVFPESPEYRHLVLAISILSSISSELRGLITSLSRYCTFSVQARRLQKIISLTRSVDSAQLPYFSIQMDQIAKIVPKHCVRKLTIFELTALFENFQFPQSTQPSSPLSINEGLLFAKDSSENNTSLPGFNKILLRGGGCALHVPLIESPILPQNHILLTKNAQFFRSYAEENPDIAATRRFSFISARKVGVNLLKIMQQDPLFAIRVFRSWLLLTDYHPSLFDTAFHLVENLRTLPFEQVNSFYDLLRFKFNVLNGLSIVESYLDRFLLAFEEILSLPFFSSENDEELKTGGLVILDCSSIKNPIHVLAIGMVLHQLRVSGYHNYSLTIPGWNHLKKDGFAFHNLKSYFGNLHFHQFFTVFSCSTDFSPLSEICDIVIEEYSSFLKHNPHRARYIYANSDSLICSIIGSSSFIIGRPSLDWIDEMENIKVHWNLASLPSSQEEMDYDSIDAEPDLKTYQEFERDYFKWVISYKLWISSPLTFEEIMDELDLLPISSQTLENILNELVEDELVLYDGQLHYSLSNKVRTTMMTIEKNHFELSPLTSEEINKRKTEYEQMDYLRKQVSRIISINDIRNLANDIYLFCKNNPRLERYSGLFFAFLVEFGYNRHQLNPKATEIVKQLLKENIENMSKTLSDDDFDVIKEIADEDVYSEENMDSDDLEKVALSTEQLPDLPASLETGFIPDQKENLPPSENGTQKQDDEFQNLSAVKDDDLDCFQAVDLHIQKYLPLEKSSPDFLKLVKNIIKLPKLEDNAVLPSTTPVGGTERSQNQNKNGQNPTKDSSSIKVASIPKPPSSFRMKDSIERAAIPASPAKTNNMVMKDSLDQVVDYDSLDLSISSEFIESVDLQFQSVAHQPPDQVMIRLFNECFIYPITEKRFYRPLPEIVDILSEVSNTCNISIQEFTNELAQNLEYWKKFDSLEQRKEIMKQIVAKFKFALENFHYSHSFRELLREKIIGNPVKG